MSYLAAAYTACMSMYCTFGILAEGLIYSKKALRDVLTLATTAKGNGSQYTMQ